MHREYFDRNASAMHRRRTTAQSILNDEIEQPAIRDLLGEKLDGATVLDIGSGSGVNAQRYLQRCAQVICVEQSEALVNICRAQLDPERSRVIHGQYLDARLGGERFDIITANFMLGYIDDLPTTLLWAAATLAPGGVLVLSGLHPVYMSLARERRGEACIDDYFEESVYMTDFLDSGAEIGLRRWRLDEVVSAARRAGLVVSAVREPRWRPVAGQGTCGRRALYARVPTVCVFKIELS